MLRNPQRSGRSAPTGVTMEPSSRLGRGWVGCARPTVMTACGSPRTVFRRLTELPDVPAAAVTAALQTLYGFFVEHYAEIVAMPSSFTSVKQGWPLAVEPSELVNTVLSKMADRISQAKSATELADRADAFCRLGYVYRAMENENNDSGRRQLRLRPLPDDWEHRRGRPSCWRANG